MLKAVLDTNVLLSALIGTGKARKLWKSAVEGEFTPVISREMLAEFMGVIERKKFASIGKGNVERFGMQVIRISTMTAIRSSYKVVTDDPDDDIVINTAYSGRAEYIVTGYTHLLAIERFKNIKLVSVNSFLQLLETIS
jgi:putative PIN family toxin of toxin-antitoxin system